MEDDPRRLKQGTVYVPIQAIDKCAVCSKRSGKLNLCARCKNRVYCSSGCQKADWDSHKPKCFKTTFLDLSVFHATLGGIAEACRRSLPTTSFKEEGIPLPLKRHVIGHTVEPLSSTTSALILELGDEFDPTECLEDEDDFLHDWWPEAPSDMVRQRIFSKVRSSGEEISLNVGAAFGVLTELYTTFGKDSLRLAYDGQPITDFGIARGKVHIITDAVATMFVLAYRDSHDPLQRIIKLQDPDDHYWLFFRTLQGQEIVCDFSVFAFNFPFMARTDPGVIVPENYEYPGMGGGFAYAPMVFFPRGEIVPIFTEWWQEEARFSVLRDPVLQRIAGDYYLHVGINPQDQKVMKDFAKKVSKRPLEDKDVEAMEFALNRFIVDIWGTVGRGFGLWKKWPKGSVPGVSVVNGSVGTPELLLDELRTLGFKV